jgi:hypothetical protein
MKTNCFPWVFSADGKGWKLYFLAIIPRDMKSGKPYFLASLKLHSQNISHCFRRKLKETLSAHRQRANRKNSVVCVIKKKGELIEMPLLFEFIRCR